MVETSWNNATKKYYEGLGYVFTGNRTKLFVNASDLHPTSNMYVRYTCDGCGETFSTKRYHYRDGLRCHSCACKTPEHKDAISKANKESWTEERRDKQRETTAAMWTEERRASHSVAMAIYWTEGRRKEKSEAQAEFWTEERRRHQSRVQIARWTPERRKEKSESQSGPKHWRWRHDKTAEERLIGRKYPEYYRWRNAVFRRDDFTCQVCGRRGGDLEAHHIRSYEDNVEFRVDENNGVTLCEGCHFLFHHDYGCGHNDEVQFEDFLARHVAKEVNSNEPTQHQASA